MRQQRISLLVIFIIFMGFFSGLGFLIGENYPARVPKNLLDLSRLQQVYAKLSQEYLFKEKIDKSKLEYGAIKGLVEAVNDPYTYFMNPEQNKNFLETINGSFEGIGAEIGLNTKNQITIVAPLEGTPAKKAGLLPGDIIIAIDEKPTTAMTLDGAIAHLKGKKGTSVTLSVQREGLTQALKILIVRDIITIPIIDWKLIDGKRIAYIQLYNFNEDSGKAFANVAEKILTSDAKKIILDLRGNPGGILQEAIKIGGWFIEKDKVIVSERSSAGKKKDYVSEGNAKLKGFPLVILIDKGSASASEILAGALKVTNKAILIGEKSFGKGTVQVVEDFSDSSALRVTISQWLLPSGESINHEGLTPDIKAPNPTFNDKTDLQLEKAIEALHNMER